jgi:hypothetical protein
MLRYVSTTAILVAAFAAGPAMAECAYKMQTTQDTIGSATMQLAQTRSDGRTLREEENRRSGTETAPAPGTLVPRGDVNNNNNTSTPQSGTVGPGQNQGSPPGTSSGSGTSGSPSTTGDSNTGTNTATNPGTSGTNGTSGSGGSSGTDTGTTGNAPGTTGTGTGAGSGTGSGSGSGSGSGGSGGSR